MDNWTITNRMGNILIRILIEWRKVLIFCLSIGMLFGGSYLIKGILSWDDKMAQFQADFEIYEKDYNIYTEESELLRQMIEEAEEKILLQNEYLNDSILMNMDSTKKNQILVDVLVQIEDMEWNNRFSNALADPTDTFLSLYDTYITQKMSWDKIAESVGIPTEYVKELVKTRVNTSGNILTIIVSHPDFTIAENILNNVLNELYTQTSNISAFLGNHTIINNGSVRGTINDQELLSYQSIQVGMVQSYRQQIDDAKARLNELHEPSWPTGEPSRKQICFTAMFLGIIGIILGVVVVISLFLIKFSCDGKIHYIEELEELISIPCLGVMAAYTSKRKKRSKFIFVDHWIEKKFIKRNIEDIVTIHKLFSQNIKNYTSEIDVLLVTGDVSEEKIIEIRNILTAQLPNLKILYGTNDKIYQLALECDAVLLIGKIDFSRTADIVHKKDVSEALGKKVIGYALV